MINFILTTPFINKKPHYGEALEFVLLLMLNLS